MDEGDGVGAVIPFDDYPQLMNPPSGFLQNCNNPFWVSTPHSGLDPLMLGPTTCNTG